MSVRMTAWVYDHCEDVKGTDRLVLLALADEADDTGGSCHPSIRRLAVKAGVDKDTAARAVRRLEDREVITVDRPQRPGPGQHNRYQLVIHRQGAEDPELSPFGDRTVPIGGQNCPHQMGTDPVPTGQTQNARTREPGHSTGRPRVPDIDAEACDLCGQREGRHANHCTLHPDPTEELAAEETVDFSAPPLDTSQGHT